MAQLLVHGGTILTQDARRPTVEALLVDGGDVVAAGSTDEVTAAARAGAERLDLAGRFACPGFIDAHNHFMFSVLAELGIDCRTPTRRGRSRELLDEVARGGRAHAARGSGSAAGATSRSTSPRGATRRSRELDAIAPDNPS